MYVRATYTDERKIDFTELCAPHSVVRECHGGEACLDFKDSASPLLEACGKVQADHTEHPRQLAWPHS